MRLHNIQGNITPGFRKDHQAFLFVRFVNGAAARRWLQGMLPDVATAEEVATFNRLFRLVKRRRRREEADVIRATWVNVALSWSGLRRLDAPDVNTFPQDFKDPPAVRAGRLGDDREKTFRDWQVGGKGSEADAFLLVGADTPQDLATELLRQEGKLDGIKPLACYEGSTLPDPNTQEHFGFRDGVSQPDPPDPLAGWVASEDIAAPGELILGYRDELGSSRFAGPPWASDGSYVVFRKLEQDVAAFRCALNLAAGGGVTADQLAAKLVGRWPSGARLGDPLEDEDPGCPGDGRARIDRVDFERDPDGLRCPLFSHVRKAYPRDLPAGPDGAWLNPDEVRRHRLIRRGVPYGPRFKSGSHDVEAKRGLLFLAYQASIARQFEHVQLKWLGGSNSPYQNAVPDALVGGAGDPATVSVRIKEENVSVGLRQFVSVAGSGYFFAPSIRALQYLADPAEGWFRDA